MLKLGLLKEPVRSGNLLLNAAAFLGHAFCLVKRRTQLTPMQQELYGFSQLINVLPVIGQNMIDEVSIRILAVGDFRHQMRGLEKVRVSRGVGGTD